MSTYRGKVRNGMIVLDGVSSLPDGTRVLVTPDEAQTQNGGVDPAYRIGDFAVDDDLPTDMAAEHDHYVYGTPKRGGR